jgi:hypothetical protein
LGPELSARRCGLRSEAEQGAVGRHSCSATKFVTTTGRAGTRPICRWSVRRQRIRSCFRGTYTP